MKHVPALELKEEADDPTAIVTKQLGDFQAAFDTRLKEIEKKAANDNGLGARLDKIEAKINRPGPAANDNNESTKLETKALNGYIRGGSAGLDDLERKTLNLGTPASGGYVVAPHYSTQIVEKLVQVSPLRALTTPMTIGTTETYIPLLVDDGDGGWVEETGTRPSSEPTFGQANIKTFEFARTVPISLQLLEDSFIDLSAFLQRHIIKRFGKSEARAFIKGDGNGKPTGLLNTPGDYVQFEAAQSGADLLEMLIDAFYGLPSEYASVGSWMMRRETMGVIRKLADGSGSNLSWADGLADGTPPTLMGRPVYESIDMDKIADAATTYPIAFGDYASAYQIVDRVGVAIQRDDFTGADNGVVKFRARRRVGGKPVLPEAVVLIKAVA